MYRRGVVCVCSSMYAYIFSMWSGNVCKCIMLGMCSVCVCVACIHGSTCHWVTLFLYINDDVFLTELTWSTLFQPYWLSREYEGSYVSISITNSHMCMHILHSAWITGMYHQYPDFTCKLRICSWVLMLEQHKHFTTEPSPQLQQY